MKGQPRNIKCMRATAKKVKGSIPRPAGKLKNNAFFLKRKPK